MKTILKLEEDLKSIHKKVASLGEVISIARPYNNLDRHFVHVEKDAIETALQKLAQNLMEVGTFTKTTVEQNRRNPDILRSAQDIFTRSLVIAAGLTELETRTNTYLELYTKHP